MAINKTIAIAQDHLRVLQKYEKDKKMIVSGGGTRFLFTKNVIWYHVK